MSNPSKKRGTAYETALLADLRTIWPGADRAKAGNESCDFVGTATVTIEAKHRKVWDLRTWIRKIRAVSDGPWVIFAADGDRRLSSSVGEVMVVDKDFGLTLLAAWNPDRVA